MSTSIKNTVIHTCSGCGKESEASQHSKSPDEWLSMHVDTNHRTMQDVGISLVACSHECVVIGYAKKVCKADASLVRPSDYTIWFPVVLAPTVPRNQNLLNAADCIHKTLNEQPDIRSRLRGESAKKLTGITMLFRRG